MGPDSNHVHLENDTNKIRKLFVNAELANKTASNVIPINLAFFTFRLDSKILELWTCATLPEDNGCLGPSFTGNSILVLLLIVTVCAVTIVAELGSLVFLAATSSQPGKFCDECWCLRFSMNISSFVRFLPKFLFESMLLCAVSSHNYPQPRDGWIVH